MICPICSQPNECGIAAVQESGADCWCFHETFPKELLEQIPVNKRGKACICKLCLLYYQASLKA